MKMKKLTITKLKKESILLPEFETLTQNNEIQFSNEGIAVIYAPNGTGKTTISNILLGESQTEFDVAYDDQEYVSFTGTNLFHVIQNQMSRNIIAGTTDEFVLGANIALERQTKQQLDEEFGKLIAKIQVTLKNDYKVTKQTASAIKGFSVADMSNLLSKVAKKGVKTSEIDMADFIAKCSALHIKEVVKYDDKKLQFFLEDISDDRKSIVEKVRAIVFENFSQKQDIRVVEQNGTAVSILKKYSQVPYCVVCDNPNIEHSRLIHEKKIKSDQIVRELSTEMKGIFEKIIEPLTGNESFKIKEILLQAIESGDKNPILSLLQEFDYYQELVRVKILNDVSAAFSESNLSTIYASYQNFLEARIELQQDDEILIKDIISESLGRSVLLERDEDKNIIIKLNNRNLIGTAMTEFHLSTGEQNFISLAFELLKAKNHPAPIIVMDDPISSFDSIYKNKIVFCIVKILEKKQQIIFTHNTDLVRLLDVQRTHCFNLYLLCNDVRESCGFIQVCENERGIILYLDKLLDLLRSVEIDAEIIDEKMYIMSLVPFMRAIIKVISPPDRSSLNDSLSALMHGYGKEKVNVTEIYNTVFQKAVVKVYEISAQDILTVDIEHLDFMKADTLYPLLYKTLRHTLTYLYLRLNVEKLLRFQFPSQTRHCELLGEFIAKGLVETKFQSDRVRLSSKKTLLNEFNHYEGNFNIFQPAIDITESNLIKERHDIMEVLRDIAAKA